MRRRAKPPPRVRLPAGSAVPPELLDPAAQVWRDFEAYRSYMEARGWVRQMEARDRVRVIDPELAAMQVSVAGESPERWRGRRWRAARAWGESVGLRDADQLRALLGRGFLVA